VFFISGVASTGEAGRDPQQIAKAIRDALDKVGCLDKEKYIQWRLSGGEQAACWYVPERGE